MDRYQEDVLRMVEERDVRFVRLWFTDVIGTLKSVAIAPAELENAFTEGIGFDGSAVQGLGRLSEADMLVRPDATTFQMLPWRGESDDTARMFSHILTPMGEPAQGDPRHVLARMLQKAERAGFTFFAHPEIEFYLFRPSTDPSVAWEPIDDGGYFDHVPRGTATDFRRDAISGLEAMGIPVEFSHHEGGPGQNEIDLRSADALTMADSVMTFRAVIKEMALQHGAMASFMPKPLIDAPGSGMHTHFSLFEGEVNAFHDPADPYELSTTARRFMAGILHHAGEITAVTNQFVNSYKRLWEGGEAPSYVCWGPSNGSALIRVPMYKPGKSRTTRIEYRGMDSAANPYLAYAMILGAGLLGIEQKMELPEGADEDVLRLTPQERKVLGIRALPTSLERALDEMRSSELAAEVLGEEAFAWFLRNKEQEWDQYRAQVTPFERERFLTVL